MLENQLPLKQLIDKMIIILTYLIIILHEITPICTLINYIKFPSHWIPHSFIYVFIFYEFLTIFFIKKTQIPYA